MVNFLLFQLKVARAMVDESLPELRYAALVRGMLVLIVGSWVSTSNCAGQEPNCRETNCQETNCPETNSTGQENNRRDSQSDRSPGERSFGRIMHEVRRQVFSSRIDFMALLSHPLVRQEVGLEDAELDALSESNRLLMEEIRAVLQADAEQLPSPNEQPSDSQDPSITAKSERSKLIARIADLVRQSESQFLEQLRTVVDYDRFLQIVIQARGNRAVVHEDVANRIGLDAAKLEEIRLVSHQCWREQWESMGDKMRELMRSDQNRSPASSGRRREARQIVERAETTVDEALALRLSSQQLEQLKQLRGEPFALPDDIFEVRLPGWSGRPGPKRDGPNGHGSTR